MALTSGRMDMQVIARIKRRLWPLVAGRASTVPTPPIDPALAFDPAFYRAYYTDMAQSPDPTLARHYALYGRAEGRHANAQAYYEALQKEHGRLPPRFDPEIYRLLHDDLRTHLRNDYEAAHHYLVAGRKEKRDFIRFDADVYRNLYFKNVVITDYELGLHYRAKGRDEGLTGSWHQFIAERGAPPGAWVDALRTDEFALLNHSWCGEIGDKLDAIDAMIREGVERLAPIAFDQRFDPDYYHEVHPEYAALDAAAMYRRWLFHDLQKSWAPSPERHLRDLGLSISVYPEGFDWRAFLQVRWKGRGNRWFALEDLLNAGFRDGVDAFAVGPRAAEFLTALGDRFRGRDDALAVAAFEAARARGEAGYAAAHHFGDALFRLARWRDALAAMQEAARFSEAGLWTFVNGARAAIRLGAFRAAEQLLAAGRGTVGGEPAFRETTTELVEAYFHARVRRIRALYANPLGRARGDAAVTAVVARVAALWEALDPTGAPVPAAAEGRVVMLASFDIRVCTHYRIEQKRELFAELDRPFEVFDLLEFDAFLSALPGAAAVIVFRLPAWPTVVRALSVARAMAIPIYYEIDDLIFDAAEYPDTLESYGGLLSAESYASILFGVPLFRAAIQLCDYGVASTPPLARAVEPLVRTGRVFWLPNGLDSRNEPFLREAPARLRRDDAVVIAYASGTTAHNSDFHEMAGPALVETLKARPNARLLLVGYLALTEAFDAVRDQIVRFDFVDGAQAFWSLLADADLNLAVLKSTWATDSKSEIKWLEAAAMGVPSIVSETATYREALEDGVDALVVRTPEEWTAALLRMVDDADLRRAVGRAAQAKAGRRYSVVANSHRLEALLTPALERRLDEARARLTPLAERRTRVLLANVWFPPQTIGGATRVLRDNLDAWLDSEEAQAFEFAVVCTDHDAHPAYRRRVDDYRGVTVHRIASPGGDGEDWRPEDARMGEIFAEILDGFAPDLVHFHAIQRLTASIVQATQAAGTPYLVTPHDAWWLSDWHFLVDDRGRVQPPGEALPRPPAGISVSRSLDRRRVLARALQGADKVLAVSEPFARIYRECGFERTIAVPNGVPPITRRARRPSASGRVRLAHIGNVVRHKGFHLVKAALLQGAFGHLELTVIDHERSAGYVDRVVWGTTPVRTIGRLAQEHISELYAETDVLLAPSIWPESFGLVTREALASGLWVVASDRGAIGEDVTPGVNGFVVGVADIDGLVGALAAIDADPERYLQSPPAPRTMRSAADQARDLATIYRELAAARPGATSRAPALRADLRR